jgi:hypothetical protein
MAAPDTPEFVRLSPVPPALVRSGRLRRAAWVLGGVAAVSTITVAVATGRDRHPPGVEPAAAAATTRVEVGADPAAPKPDAPSRAPVTASASTTSPPASSAPAEALHAPSDRHRPRTGAADRVKRDLGF